MTDKTKPTGSSRRDDPTRNQSGDPHDPDAPTERAEAARNDGKAPEAGVTGFGPAGELRVGRITLGLAADNTVLLGHENVGTRTQVDQSVISTILLDHFFKDHPEPKSSKRDTTLDTPADGLTYDGDFRLGALALRAAGDKEFTLRRISDGKEISLNGPAIEGILEDKFFTRKITNLNDTDGGLNGTT